jgi:chitin disaccharide deacetylase
MIGSLMQARRLILTADDFGRSSTVNAAVERWFRAGALTQASLMVCEPNADDAVQIARRNPGLRAGLHLTLCDGRASDGNTLPRSPALAGLRFAFWPGARAWLRREIGAQFQRFRETGLPPTYWDGHTHLHLHPVVMRLAIPIAREHGFTFTRLVREPGPPPALLPWIFRRLSESAVPRLRSAGIGFTDAVFGLRKTGRMDAEEFERAIAHPGDVEIYFHPGAESRPPEPEEIASLLSRTIRPADQMPARRS